MILTVSILMTISIIRKNIIFLHTKVIDTVLVRQEAGQNHAFLQPTEEVTSTVW